MKPSIPRGTRDFGPAEMQKRQYIFNIVKANFQLFGYAPIETPTMENSSTLMGKYGDEGDKLIFKILNSGDYLAGINNETFEKFRIKKITPIPPVNGKSDGVIISTKENVNEFTKLISEKALRYDLTVPFARYVVMNNHAITYPFKRYQIQPVWRADKPQKGRYREFYQCDADVIGSNSLINELELISMIDKSFSELNVPVLLKLNNRKILSGIAEVIGEPEKIIDITIAIDKFDKIGLTGVNEELKEKGLSETAINELRSLFELTGNTASRILQLKLFLATSQVGLKGIEEIEFLLNNLSILNIKHISIELDITLARGLNYYTGTIFEAKANAGTFTPSILGGGRYDDLTGIFGLKGLSGVGISFGVDRIYDVMEELNLFPEAVDKVSTTKILLANFGEAELMHCVGLVSKLRAAGINAEVYPDVVKKISKQFEYADKKQIPFVGVIGGNEMTNNTVMLKNMITGIQEEVNFEKLVETLK